MGCELLHREYVSLSDDSELNCVTFNGFLHLHNMFECEAHRLRISPLILPLRQDELEGSFV